MKFYSVRFLSILLGLAIGAILLNINVTIPSGLWFAFLLTLMYVFIRPLMQVVILVFNVFVFGLLSIVTDALFVIWAAAWTPNLAFSYTQGLLLALLMSICFFPYVYFKAKNQLII